MKPIVRQLASSYFPGETQRLIGPFNQLPAYGYIVVDFLTQDETLTVHEGGLLSTEECFGFTFE